MKPAGNVLTTVLPSILIGLLGGVAIFMASRSLLASLAGYVFIGMTFLLLIGIILDRGDNLDNGAMEGDNNYPEGRIFLTHRKGNNIIFGSPVRGNYESFFNDISDLIDEASPLSMGSSQIRDGVVLVVNTDDVFDDLEAFIGRLVDFRKLNKVVTIVTSSDFTKDDYSRERAPICDASIRYPSSLEKLELVIDIARGNFVETFRHLSRREGMFSAKTKSNL